MIKARYPEVRRQIEARIRSGQWSDKLPGVAAISSGAGHLPHIASNQNWETEVTLFNTTEAAQVGILTFDNGTERTISLPAYGQQTFSIASLFEGVRQPTIGSGILTGANGIIGLELFRNEDELFGLILEDQGRETVYFPHTVTNERWSTGIIVYNPAPEPHTATITAFDGQGVSLTSQSFVFAPQTRFGGSIDAKQETPPRILALIQNSDIWNHPFRSTHGAFSRAHFPS